MAAAEIKSEVEIYKGRLTEKFTDARKLLEQEIPADTKQILKHASQIKRLLQSRLDSFTESVTRFKTKGAGDPDINKIFLIDQAENILIQEQTKELINGLEEVITREVSQATFWNVLNFHIWKFLGEETSAFEMAI